MGIEPKTTIARLVVAALFGLLSTAFLTSTAQPAQAQAAGDNNVPGDVDCSGATDVIDALMIVLFIVELREAGGPCPIDRAVEIDTTVADLDRDGQVTILDALVVARCDAGIDVAKCAPQSDNATVSNDELVNAIEVFPNATGYATPTFVPGDDATLAAGENTDTCISTIHDQGSVWYTFEATSTRLSIVHDGDDQFAGIYRAAEGIAVPAQIADLELISCNEVPFDAGAIVQPGETYWVAISGTWWQPLWFFDRPGACVDGGGQVPNRPPCPGAGNDDIARAIGIDLRGDGPVLVDDPGNPSITYSADEVGPVGDTDCSWGFLNGSLWYSVVATGDQLQIKGSDDQYVAVFATTQPNRPADGLDIWSLDDLVLLDCAEPQHRPLVETIPGETYYIASWDQYPEQPFTLNVPLTPDNDEVVNATPLSPAAEGTFVPAVGSEYRASFAPGEGPDTCHGFSRGNGSMWYRIQAPSGRLSLLPESGGRPAAAAIFTASAGVSEPTGIADLDLLACGDIRGDISVITQPGETYWMSHDKVESGFWIIDGDLVCVIGADGSEQCPGPSNDDVRRAAVIDPPSLGESILIDDFVPLTLTYSNDELRAAGCFASRGGVRPSEGSIWYRVVAAGDRLEILGNDDQDIGIYATREPIDVAGVMSSVNGLRDLDLLACGEPEERPVVATIPGETYYIVSFGQYPSQPFSLGAPLRIPNDEITTATALTPSAAGTRVAAYAPEYRASFADDETRETCHRGNRRQTGSAWYRFVATSGRVSVSGDNPPFPAGIYAAAPGVVEPLQMSDLVLLSCDSRMGPDAIVQPGQTYWISVDNIDTEFWLFDRSATCVVDSAGFERCPWRTNDDIRKAAGIDISRGAPVVVDDFSPGSDGPGNSNVDLTAAFGEAAEGNCIDAINGTVWYRIVAPSTSIDISSIDDQTVAVYQQSPEAQFGVQSLRDVTLVGCGAAETLPGEVYYLVASGLEPTEVFSISW